MSKAFIATTIQDSTCCTGVSANAAAGALISAIVKQMKRDGGFTLPGFGTFRVAKTNSCSSPAGAGSVTFGPGTCWHTARRR